MKQSVKNYELNKTKCLLTATALLDEMFLKKATFTMLDLGFIKNSYQTMLHALQQF